MTAASTSLASQDGFVFPDGPYPTPYKVHLSDAFLDMTLRKVRDYRPISGFSTEWSVEGPPPHEINRVAKAWSTSYDWRSVEKQINTNFHHYATVVEGSGNYHESIPLHFIHHKAAHQDAIPLLLLHGWPSSFLEWSKVVDLLSKHPEQSFHVVAPSLPGFGPSPAPKKPGMGPREMGKAFDALMRQLGYEKYGIVSTDLGWTVGTWMTQDVPDSLIGHMCDFFFLPPSDEDGARMQKGELSAEEAGVMASINVWFKSHSAYSTVHSQKPLALSFSMADSPMGLLAWIWDLSQSVSDGYKYSEEELITDTMMLWVPGAYANIRSYLEFFKPENMNFSRSEVPTGVSQWGWSKGPFPEVASFPFFPEDWIKRAVNLAYFKRHESGGHFPSVNEPELWVQDVRNFFSQVTASQ